MVIVGLPWRPSWLTGALAAWACRCKLPFTAACKASQKLGALPFLALTKHALPGFQACFSAYASFASSPRFQLCTARLLVFLLKAGQNMLHGDDNEGHPQALWQHVQVAAVRGRRHILLHGWRAQCVGPPGPGDALFSDGCAA